MNRFFIAGPWVKVTASNGFDMGGSSRSGEYRAIPERTYVDCNIHNILGATEARR